MRVQWRNAGQLLPGLVLCSCGFAATVYLLALSWNVPVLDMYGFRQAQTALSAFWIGKGESLFGYITPVVGFPWSVPFEFPLYQWIVAAVVPLGLSIDQAGRVVGVAFFFASAHQLYFVTKRLSSGDAKLALCVAGAYMVSPLNVFWARSVMIESLAVYLSILFLRGLVDFHRTRKPVSAGIAVLAAVLAALVKITTFFGFAVAAAAFLVYFFFRAYSRKKLRDAIPVLALSAVSVAISLIALVAWLHYADALKERSVIGPSLVSTALSKWNYGTWQQKLDPAFWSDVAFGRSVRQILGSGWILLGAAAILLARRRYLAPAMLLLAAYMVPFLTFANLHNVHSYYQFANALFLCAVPGLAICSLTGLKGRFGEFAALAAAVVLCSISMHRLHTEFTPSITGDLSASRVIRLARVIREKVPADDVIVGFGLEWSSEVPYYSMHRGMMAPDWITRDQLLQMESPSRIAGQREVGALIVCPNSISRDAERRQAYADVVETYSKGKSEMRVAGCRVYLSPAVTGS